MSSDYADNSFMKVDDRFIQATSVHEVGNALSILTKKNPPIRNHPEAFREKNPGAALEDCVYGGKVKKDGTIRTTNWENDPSSRDPGKY